eukprot:360459-Chlamydomonas_euryale.AAC.5
MASAGPPKGLKPPPETATPLRMLVSRGLEAQVCQRRPSAIPPFRATPRNPAARRLGEQALGP